MGFYLRALHICSPKYLDNEFDNIEKIFLNFVYPKLFIQSTKSKVLKILKRKRSQTINTPPNIRLPHKHTIFYLVILPLTLLKIIEITLVLKLQHYFQKLLRNLLNTKFHQHIKSNAGFYSIPYNNCKRKYIAENARNLKNLYMSTNVIFD